MFFSIPEPELITLIHQYNSFSEKWQCSRGEDRILFICSFISQTLMNTSWPTSSNPDIEGRFFKPLVALCDKRGWTISNRAGISFVLWLDGCSDCGILAKRVKYKRCFRCGMLHKERVQEHVAERAKLARPQPRAKTPELKSWFELKGLIRSSIRGMRSS